MALTPEALIPRVQVNIPFPFLGKGYLDLFLDRGLNPEIGLDAYSLSHFQRRDFARTAWAFHQARRRLTLHAPFQDLLPGALDEMILYSSRRRLGQAFRLLPVFKPVTIVCHLGYDAKFYQWERRDWLARSAATWKEFSALATAHGVTVMVENVYETDPDLFVQLLTLVNAPNLQVCLDVGHLQAFGGGDFERWLNTLWPLIGQLHLHDNRGDQDTHLALGRGTVPLESVLHFLAGRDRQPLVTLEPHQEGSLAPSLEYLAAIWPWE
ncbi:MAG: sugar phosphate isomerase/epimerase [Deltaproteobacteria bacterium]|nr:sugar phosphate isomerase/epimerase [Deltaproteobacteria bacterium]